MAQEAILKPKIYQTLCAELVPSLADKIRLEFAHHQTPRVCWGLTTTLDKTWNIKQVALATCF